MFGFCSFLPLRFFGLRVREVGRGDVLTFLPWIQTYAIQQLLSGGKTHGSSGTGGGSGLAGLAGQLLSSSSGHGQGGSSGSGGTSQLMGALAGSLLGSGGQHKPNQQQQYSGSQGAGQSQAGGLMNNLSGMFGGAGGHQSSVCWSLRRLMMDGKLTDGSREAALAIRNTTLLQEDILERRLRLRTSPAVPHILHTNRRHLPNPLTVQMLTNNLPPPITRPHSNHHPILRIHNSPHTLRTTPNNSRTILPNNSHTTLPNNSHTIQPLMALLHPRSHRLMVAHNSPPIHRLQAECNSSRPMEWPHQIFNTPDPQVLRLDLQATARVEARVMDLAHLPPSSPAGIMEVLEVLHRASRWLAIHIWANRDLPLSMARLHHPKGGMLDSSGGNLTQA